MNKKKAKLEDCLDLIDKEIKKRRSKWSLTALAWMDFDDVSQIIKIHIFKKWKLYDSSKPLAPWINRIISNQIKNLIRNHYGNFCRPCLKCAAAEPNDLCYIYGSQCGQCPLYFNWEKNKKVAYETKLPSSLDAMKIGVSEKEDKNVDFQKAIETLNFHLKKSLKETEWTVYENIFLLGKSEKCVAKLLGYKTNEVNRNPGYKQIKNIKKKIIEKAKHLLESGEVEI